jgi:hypothetical protein
MRIALLLILLAVPATLIRAWEKPYQNGKVIKITREVRSETGPDSVMPPQGEDDRRRPQPSGQSYGEVYHISIQSGDAVYVGEVMPKAVGFDPQLLTSDRHVQIRLNATTMYIKPSQGQEFATRLVPNLVKREPEKLKP